MSVEGQTYEQIIEAVAIKLNLPTEVVDRTYRAYWKFVRNYLSNLPLKKEMTQEEFQKLRTSINVPSLGKFACSWDRYTRLRKRLMYINKLQNTLKQDDEYQEN